MALAVRRRGGSVNREGASTLRRPDLRHEEHESLEEQASSDDAETARFDPAIVQSPSDVLRLQRTIGNYATSAVLRSRMLQRLGTPLDKPLPSGAPVPAEGEEAGKQRRYTPEQYMEMWEAEQGRKLSPEEKETIDRGCIGLTANNLHGGGDPPLDLVFGTFDKAHSTMVAKNAVLDWMAAVPLLGLLVPKARYIVFAKLFWSNQDPDPKKRKKGKKDAFRPDPKTGQVDMTGYDYQEQPGFTNFDYGWWDESSQSFWHANHMDYGDPDDPMIVLQSTRDKFAKTLTVAGTRRYGYPDFDRVVYGVALAENYDPGRAAMTSAAH
jgi:Microbial transglutaminase